jgi:hypothetical protein
MFFILLKTLGLLLAPLIIPDLFLAVGIFCTLAALALDHAAGHLDGHCPAA